MEVPLYVGRSIGRWVGDRCNARTVRGGRSGRRAADCVSDAPERAHGGVLDALRLSRDTVKGSARVVWHYP